MKANVSLNSVYLCQVGIQSRFELGHPVENRIYLSFYLIGFFRFFLFVVFSFS